jgi:hypothetical protein
VRPSAAAIAAVLACCALGEDAKDGPKDGARPPTRAAKPEPFEARGKLVCLAEEMAARHGAPVAPVHEHLLGFQVESPTKEGVEYYAVLRTPIAEGLFQDARFKAHVLVITGRRFPGTALIEVTRTRWVKDGKLHDVYYWCEVCSIRGVNPGPCACCQGPVELREAPVAEEPRPASK